MSRDHIHLFIQYPPKYSVSFIAKRLKGRTSRILRQEFPELKKWCEKSLWAPSGYHGSVGHGWEVVENISPDKIENRDAEYYKQALDLTGCPTITGSNNFLPYFSILRSNSVYFY